MIEHNLMHREFTDGRLTPACTCGWYSPNRDHSEFERHKTAVLAVAERKEPTDE